MRILMIAQHKLKKEFGGVKVVLEIADELRKLRCKVVVVGPDEITFDLKQKGVKIARKYSSNVKSYIRLNSDNYDVIDYDANYLPYRRTLFSNKTVMVARSVLLILHLKKINLPLKKDAYSSLKRFIKYPFEKFRRERQFYYFTKTLLNADLITVPNEQDKEYLLGIGFPSTKILLAPYGLDHFNRKVLNGISLERRRKNNIVFIGTFDYRKGCLDIVKIFDKVRRVIKDAHLTLLGTKGLHQTKEEVMRFFPQEMWHQITVKTHFSNTELPYLLKKQAVGIFPSYLESFGFAVLEMITAGIPVFAYDVPGPSSILPREYLIERGDYNALADKLIHFMKSKELWNYERDKVSKIGYRYTWKSAAHITFERYKQLLGEKTKLS